MVVLGTELEPLEPEPCKSCASPHRGSFCPSQGTLMGPGRRAPNLDGWAEEPGIQGAAVEGAGDALRAGYPLAGQLQMVQALSHFHSAVRPDATQSLVCLEFQLALAGRLGDKALEARLLGAIGQLYLALGTQR